MVVAPLAIAAVAWFLARSRFGLAVRASAERTDRAAMLGIPVARINTVVWTLAAVLAFLALFLKSGITGVPLGYAVGLPTLLQALAALVIGRLERLPTIIAMALALGLLESGVQWNSDSPFVVYPIMAGVMFVVLLVQRPRAEPSRQRCHVAVGVAPTRCGRCPADVLANPWVSTLRWTLIAAAVDGRRAVPGACCRSTT